MIILFARLHFGVVLIMNVSIDNDFFLIFNIIVNYIHSQDFFYTCHEKKIFNKKKHNLFKHRFKKKNENKQQ